MLAILSAIAHFLCMQDGATALMRSAYNGCTATAKVLVQHGADVNIQNQVSRGEGWCGCGLVMRCQDSCAHVFIHDCLLPLHAAGLHRAYVVSM